jgi:hypothetical protein
MMASSGGQRVVIGVAFDGKLELGDELTACPKTASGKGASQVLLWTLLPRDDDTLPD